MDARSLLEEMSKTGVNRKLCLFPSVIVLFGFCSWIQILEGACMPRKGCSTALAYYTVTPPDSLNHLVQRFQTTVTDVLVYNNLSNPNIIQNGNYILFPFPCECVDDLLGHSYTYTVQLDDTFSSIANLLFEGLSTADWIAQASGYSPDYGIYKGLSLQVPVNCSCGNSTVSPDYGLFATYPAVSTDNITTLATKFEINETILQQYNPSVNWNDSLSNGEILYIPVREAMTGLFPPYNFSDDGRSSTNDALIIGCSVGGVAGLLLFTIVPYLCFIIFRRKRRATIGANRLREVESGSGFSRERPSGRLKLSSDGTASSSIGSGHGTSALSDLTVDKSVEFSFEELAAATNNFSAANKIGEGGYGGVYLANLRGQKMAVKRMNLQATREFLAELQILTHVHHTNLVRLIGYCTVDSLFLIYEYVENGTLDRHLHGTSDFPPLSWASRVQIALDAARGLEYIHEHTKPTYIHRDVKSSNILIDKQLRAKVADFGLTKLTESGLGSVSMTFPSRLVGTFGYMSPEYARFGDVSTKVDVYSFGVVLFEIISAKHAIVRTVASPTHPPSRHKEEHRGLVSLFEEVLKDPNGKEELGRLVDPALHGNYPLEPAWKMTQLAGACTQANPVLRPSMRTAVVVLMTLSSTTHDWDMRSVGSDGIMTGLISPQ